MARHHTFLTMGIGLMAMSFIFALTGRSLVKGRGLISRVKDPKTFWGSVATYLVLGLLCLALYVYTTNGLCYPVGFIGLTHPTK